MRLAICGLSREATTAQDVCVCSVVSAVSAHSSGRTHRAEETPAITG